MGHFKLLPIFLLGLVSISNQQSSFTLENNFEKLALIYPNSVFECEVTSTKPVKTSSSDIKVSTQKSAELANYIFYPIPKGRTCVSLQVKSGGTAKITLSATPSSVKTNRVDIIIASGDITISETINGDEKNKKETVADLINANELRGFWIRWKGVETIEVGKDSTKDPIVSYTFRPGVLAKFSSFIGLLSDGAAGEWVLHGEAKCGEFKDVAKIQAETVCGITTQVQTPLYVATQNTEKYHLERINAEYTTYKSSLLRTKDLLNSYLVTLRLRFVGADLNQNILYSHNSDFFWPLQKTTFNDIVIEYFQLLQDIQAELVKIPNALATVCACP